jgi:hypothetical protein
MKPVIHDIVRCVRCAVMPLTVRGWRRGGLRGGITN